jgi:hypothetical protein
MFGRKKKKVKEVVKVKEVKKEDDLKKKQDLYFQLTGKRMEDIKK